MSFYAIQTCRPPPKPPNMQGNSRERKRVLEKESLPYIEPEYRPLPKPPRIQDNAEEKVWPPHKFPKIQNVSEKGKIWNYMPLPNPPNIENIDIKKNWNYRPPLEPCPGKFLM